jgi:UDP-N-acetylglucosamine:LPS N-acetylglucosamine transferase
MKPVIDLVYFHAGGGHRAAALALEAVIAQQKYPWTVRLVNLTEVLDRRGQFRRLMGFDPEDFYNKRLQKGWTLGLAQELKLLQGLIRWAHAPMLRQLQRHWARTEPDLVVSLVPNFNRVLYESVVSTLPGTPYVTVITDLADHPPHFWIEPGQDQYLVCGTERALAQARAAGYRNEQLALTSGMVLRPSFYGLPPLAQNQRAQERQALGLDPDRPTGVVMFGGQGSQQMLAIAKTLGDVQLVLLCGRNEVLAERLRRLQRAAPHAVFGFTDDVPAALRLGDFFIGKPGPASLSEALHLGLPVITFRNAWTMPQERYNADWVREQGLGLVVRSVRELPGATQALLPQLARFQAAAAALNNRAVFELPQILAERLHGAAAALHSRRGLPLHAAPAPREMATG